ncbi:Permease component of an ABC-transporter [Planctomycetales bacterium 10988]|nr:Permease component of an ABC-transporter [Planctomycetales bacterium 10988]
MAFWENPVLQRELLSNLRESKAFILLFLYVGIAATILFFAWPNTLTVNLVETQPSRRLFDLYVVGQFILISLITPVSTAGSITGEKERKTYEMLLASPLTPSSIVAGKLLSSLCFLGLLIFATFPLVMLCLPLGGVNFFEALAAYVNFICAAASFGMISLGCSTYFRRTAASLVVSYMCILPIALAGMMLWLTMGQREALSRLVLSFTFVPLFATFLSLALFGFITHRLLYPPDLGSEAREILDEEEEQREAVGMVIHRNQFPDYLFVPSHRKTLLEDGVNPVYDKELRSEIFSSGTLMLRLVIQVGVFLALPVMAFTLFIWPQYAAWYAGYVLLFNLLIGPVFSADAVASERERQTFDLLLTTTLTPQSIVWPKLFVRLRIALALTMIPLLPLPVAAAFVLDFWGWNWLTLLGYLAVVMMACLTTCTTALFCSCLFRKTSTSLVTSYTILLILFLVPLAFQFFVSTFLYEQPELVQLSYWLDVLSPFRVVNTLPLFIEEELYGVNWFPFVYYLGFYSVWNFAMIVLMLWTFQRRWRIAQT